jgi:hypothetical protein
MGVNPIPRVVSTHRYGEYAGRARGLGQIVRRGAQEAVGSRILFQHPEALAKLIRGLRAVRNSAVRDIEALRNVVIVFYKSEECRKEVCEDRLGWNPDGTYDPPRVGCRHYKRHLRMKAPCCGKWVDCEHCHDEKAQCERKMPLKDVSVVQCLYCFTPQYIDRSCTATSPFEFGNGVTCVECQRHFAESACVPCRLWRNSDKLAIDLKHCEECERCYPSTYFEFHRQLCRQEHVMAQE